MADLPSISTRIQELERSYSTWNDLALWFTAGAAICATLTTVCAVGYFFTAYRANKNSQDLNLAIKEESRLKDEQRQKERQDADARIAEAHERTRQLDLRLAEQRERAALAEHNLIAMKERMFVWRGFDWNKLWEILKGSAKGSVRILCVPDSKEALNFAQSLSDLLKLAGWKVSGPEVDKAIRPFAGLRIEFGSKISDEKTLPPHITALKEALSLSEPIIIPNKTLPPNGSIVFVGTVI